MLLHKRSKRQQDIGRVVLIITLFILTIILVVIKSCTNQPAFN